MMANENKNDNDQFSEDERITANLRLQSVSPVGRTLLGLFYYIPPVWRGPVAVIVAVILGVLAFDKVPAIVEWAKGAFK